MPGLSRRSFLGLGAAFVLDPERLLWVRGAKHISIPAPVSVIPVRWVEVSEPTWRRLSAGEWFATLDSINSMMRGANGGQ